MTSTLPRPPMIGIHGWGLYDMDLDEAFTTAASRGFKAMDLGSGDLGRGTRVESVRLSEDPAECERVAGLAAAANIQLKDMFVATPGLVNDPDPTVRERNRTMIQGLCANAARIGLPGLTFSPGGYAPTDWRGSFDTAADALREMVDIGARNDVVIRIEPHVHSVTDTPERALEMAQAVPGLTFTLDYSHFISAGIDQAAIEPLHPLGTHWHARQARPGRLAIEVEEGTIDFRRLMTRLHAEAYQGAIAVEYVNTTAEGQDQIDVDTENMRMAEQLRALVAELWTNGADVDE